MTRKLGVLLLLLLHAVSAVAQVPYIETLEVRVHSVDVVVTDAKGNPVAGLGPDDFQLLEDGVEKPITNFSGFSGGAAGSSPQKADASGLKPAAPPVDEPKRAPRKFIFYIDEMSLGATLKPLETQLVRLVDTAMQPGDEAMIVRPAEEKKLATPFIGDRDAVRTALIEAVRKERWRADAPILRELRLLDHQMSGVSTGFAGRVGARRWAGIVRSRVEQRLGQLRAVVNAAAGIEGRKVLVLVTESMPLEPGKEAFTAMGDVVTAEIDPSFYDGAPAATNFDSTVDWVSLKPLVEEIGRTAATNGISIYPVQPEYGLSLLAPGGDIGAANPTRLSGMRTPASNARLAGTGNTMLVEHMTSNTEATLKPLAEMTGGTWHRGGLQLDDMVNRIVDDVQSYYSLGYRAGEKVDTANKIEVRVKGRPELRVRTRQEVMRKSPQREMTDRVVASLLDPSDSNELGIRLEVKQVSVAADRHHKTVWVAARVPLSTLTFVPEGDMLQARFSVHYAATGIDSDFASGVHGEQVVEIPAAKFDEVKDQNWTYVVPLNLRPAKHTIAIGVLDSLSNLSGFGTMELNLQ